MPSPRLLGSGAKKILILPQVLENHVFNIVVLCCYTPKLILSLLLVSAVISDGTCDLEVSLTLFSVIVK